MTLPRLYILPIEPLAERYTGAWYQWLPQSFSKAFSIGVIDGKPLTSVVQTGAFLDLNSTAHYKATQLAQVAEMFHNRFIRSGDSFFVSDIEFWGLESIRYLARLQGIAVKIYGFLHAGSYTHGDFMEPMADIGRMVEPAWIQTCDKVFVGSKYHHSAVTYRRLSFEDCTVDPDRIVVTGNPWRTTEAHQLVGLDEHTLCRMPRDVDVLYPHRPDKEKRPGVFLDYLNGLGFTAPGAVVFTTGRKEYRSSNYPEIAERIMGLGRDGFVRVWPGLDREHFYKALARAKVVVSTAMEENFGYAMVEAMALGALPLMPRCASYPELVLEDDRFLYDPESKVDFQKQLKALLADTNPDTRLDAIRYARRFDRSESNILAQMTA